MRLRLQRHVNGVQLNMFYCTSTIACDMDHGRSRRHHPRHESSQINI